MKSWLRALDRILRGEMIKIGSVQESLAEVPIAGMVVLIIALGAVYGMGMGTFALAKSGGPSYAQFIASGVKIPALFLLTLLVTFPSLYVFNALVGSRLNLLALVRLLLASMGVTLAVLASMGPIVAFFSVSTTSYPFMVLLNVAVCATAGVLGLSFMRQALHRLTGGSAVRRPPPFAPPQMPVGALPPGPLDLPEGEALGAHVRGVFRCWMVVFALVGSQMAWVLRPFIGHPGKAFTLFRPREDNFFMGVWQNVLQLFQ